MCACAMIYLGISPTPCPSKDEITSKKPSDKSDILKVPSFIIFIKIKVTITPMVAIQSNIHISNDIGNNTDFHEEWTVYRCKFYDTYEHAHFSSYRSSRKSEVPPVPLSVCVARVCLAPSSLICLPLKSLLGHTKGHLSTLEHCPPCQPLNTSSCLPQAF